MAHGHELVLVGTAPAADEYTAGPADFAALAEEAGAPYFCDPAINRPEYQGLVEEAGAEVAISVNWPTLIGREMLDRFPHGVVNAHAGDLPRYRGNATPNWAILAGEERVVLTLHRMGERLDAGPILAQRAFPLSDTTYVGDVYRFLAEAVPELFVLVLDGLRDGSLAALAQPEDPALSLRCYPRHPRDSQLDWDRTADELSRLVRASAEPFSGAYSFLGTERVVVWRAHVEPVGHPYLGTPGQVIDVRRRSGEVAVLTGDGALVLEEVETPAGRGPATEHVRSTRTRFGLDVSEELGRLRDRVRELEELVSKHLP